MQGWRVMLAVKSQRARGAEQKYPIKLFYTSNMPIILQTAFVSNLYFMSQMFYNQAPNSPFVKLFGDWSPSTLETGAVTNTVPVGGLAYY
eukprot:13851825-Ditylum_brightwellii.AAC.1